ncbi:hypothetical protein HPB50_010648 [Hyalomma asiaticum]|uniref:Uncharacterized protein n=1 Tax=Hyalomma asiaticum TaxID=266040 RepID=A0ACB7RNF4_HYAAI|nr:hypothetical protein HPB50_010648 [Hyalomma asiaticum]
MSEKYGHSKLLLDHTGGAARPSSLGAYGRPGTATATVADTQVGYDPDSMMWTTIPSSNSRPELPKTFKSAALANAVAR